MPGRPASMQDVADYVGLSRTTVSFVLNGRTDARISEESRRRVWEAVAALGYRPNAAAKALAGRTTDFIGLVTDITTSPFAAGIITGAQRSAWDAGKLLLIASTEGDQDITHAAFETMLERRVQGVLYATDFHHAVTLPKSAREIPTVLVNCFDEQRTFPSIVPDEFDGGFLATQRLIDAGHRRIGMINLIPTIPAAIGRRAGYEAALENAGIEVDAGLVVDGYGEATGAYDCATTLLALPEPPTAIFCGNDRMAMGAYDSIREHGLSVPADISVVGYDNQEIIAAFVRPPLTTVALPFEEMGSTGVALLASLAEGGGGAQQLEIKGPLIERDSVRPLRR